MPAYPRKEIEEMVERWLAANLDSERAGDWVKSLGKMYTEDAEYSWNMGPNREFIARGGWGNALWVLGFIFLYKLGDSMATALATKFYIDLGFSMTEIGVVSKTTSLWASVAVLPPPPRARSHSACKST